MKRVKVFKYENKPGKSHVDMVFEYEGNFIEWGVEWEQVGEGPAMFTAAIVVKDDGRVDLVYANLIQFIV